MDKYLGLYWIESSPDGKEYHSVCNFKDLEAAISTASASFKHSGPYVRVTAEQPGKVFWSDGSRIE